MYGFVGENDCWFVFFSYGATYAFLLLLLALDLSFLEFCLSCIYLMGYVDLDTCVLRRVVRWLYGFTKMCRGCCVVVVTDMP